MARSGAINQDIVLRNKFYKSGALFTPYSITSVKVFDASSGGNLKATLSAVLQSTGIYGATWSIPGTTQGGTYWDEWVWTATEGMSTKTQRNSFTVVSSLIYPDSVEDPTGTGGPLFIGQREVDFFNGVTKELLQKIIHQTIIYYSVSEEHTNTHRLYDEAIKKTVYRPVEVNALVLFEEPTQTATEFTIDTGYRIEVYFHIHELEERNLIPREGDFIGFGDIIYEIEKLNKPQIIYGQIGNKVMVKSICRVSRKSQFEIVSNTE